MFYSSGFEGEVDYQVVEVKSETVNPGYSEHNWIYGFSVCILADTTAAIWGCPTVGPEKSVEAICPEDVRDDCHVRWTVNGNPGLMKKKEL